MYATGRPGGAGELGLYKPVADINVHTPPAVAALRTISSAYWPLDVPLTCVEALSKQLHSEVAMFRNVLAFNGLPGPCAVDSLNPRNRNIPRTRNNKEPESLMRLCDRVNNGLFID